MSKCNKPKNACKICLTPVTQKNGLQCQGACQSWVHYACLNYTPGRINDIKKGIIKVTCPCPDCKTTQPKEYRTDQPYSCSNSQCPANVPPRCENLKCPINKGDAMIQTPSQKCPLGRCGTDCKQHSSPQLPNAPSIKFSNPCAPAPRVRIATCPSGCTNTSSDIPGDREGSKSDVPMDAVAQMCNTVGLLTNQINELMNKMKQLTEDSPSRCPPSANRSLEKANCPKPCFCPGNPRNK
ncbi:uncharacterized protein LOC115444278 [Manduca sexta]|uniref:PHD-type domain-containing protein n=1 Tax=Manduca sexta TaxID=7130 RepID=A0A922CME0_MANSE|nr:uncharacterized protein LOC115444278 [Manduca sexta]KAG6451249.1 hypothetical protein O3G_MSEX007004 [Manduca sexta]